MDIDTGIDTGAVPLSGSRELHDRAQVHLAGGVSTAFRSAEKPVPLFCDHAEGAAWVDVDGNSYVDFVCGYGPVILGHGDAEVASAAAAAAAVQQVGGQHRGELELAELLCSLIPSLETVRFSLSGSEAVHGAIRLARGVTGRSLVVKFAGHYHGWLDGIFVGLSGQSPAPESRGQPSSALEDVVLCDWNDPAALQRIFERESDRIAAVIMEPLPCNQGVFYPAPGYLELVRKLTRDSGSILIFDEVITGFRAGLGGVQQQFGVTPDITVVAKAMANGFPISAFGGEKDLMAAVAANEVVHAGTYNGGGASVAAAIATISRLQSDPGIHTRMERLGKRLMTGLCDAATANGLSLFTRGPGPVFFAWFAEGPVESFKDHLEADAGLYAEFAEQMLAQGVRIIPAGRWYLTAAHDDEHVERAVEAADRAFSQLG